MNSDIKVTEANLNVEGGRFGIVVARFNSFVVESLLDGAIDALIRHGANVTDIHVVRVPGAFEMPIAAQRMVQ